MLWIQRVFTIVSEAFCTGDSTAYHSLMLYGMWMGIISSLDGVHSGIDGYSRVVTCLKVATNNTSQTALSAFLEGVSSYGLPLRVRTDRGGENALIAEYMVQHRGAGQGSIIMGRSVHNQRIE